jgi:NitT/TauT family transport system substrate-binding protein
MNAKKIIKAISIMLAIALTTSCGFNPTLESGYKETKIRLVCGAAYSSVVAHVVKLKGLLDNKLPEDVSAEWITIESSAGSRDALASNQVDVAYSSLITIISGIENGLPVTILSNSSTFPAYIYSNNPDINHLEDIKPTHRVAISSLGGANHLSLLLASKEAFGNVDQFNSNLSAMSYSDILASLMTSKDIDCAVIGFPNVSAANRIQNLKVIHDLTPILKKYNLGHCISASQSFSENNPVLIKAVLDATQEAMDFLNNNPSEAAKLLTQQYSGVSVEEIEEQIKAIPFTTNISESSYNSIASLMYEISILTTPPKKFSELSNYDAIPKIK